MDFSNEMDEVEEYLRTKKFPASVGPDKGKRANFRRKCKAFVIHDNCLMFVHKPSRSDQQVSSLFVETLRIFCDNYVNLIC